MLVMMMKHNREANILSKREEQLIDLLKDVDSVVLAANKMNIKRRTAYNMLYSLRKKYYKARRLVNKIEALKRSHKLLKMVLTDRIQEKVDIREEF
jgi:DNA-binding CsgD family transcriptional regulator